MPRRKPKDPCQQIYDGLREENIDEVRVHKTPAKRIRASEAANCPRQIYYRLSGVRPAPRSADSSMYGIGGDIDHDICRQMLNHFGVPVEGVTFHKDGNVEEDGTLIRSFPVHGPDGEITEVTFSARGDGILPETPRGRCLLEIKGIGFWDNKYLCQEFTRDGHAGALNRIHKKRLSYEWQCEITMRLFEEEQTYLMIRDRSGAGMGVCNPITGERSGLYIKRDDERWQEILKTAAYIFRRLEQKKPPTAVYPAGASECGWCPFHYLCHGAEKRKQQGLVPHVLYPGPQLDAYKEETE